jgi:hypothetical protein
VCASPEHEHAGNRDVDVTTPQFMSSCVGRAPSSVVRRTKAAITLVVDRRLFPTLVLLDSPPISPRLISPCFVSLTRLKDEDKGTAARNRVKFKGFSANYHRLMAIVSEDLEVGSTFDNVR